MSERADLKAPCVFCGYNGPRYWQSGTHHHLCPWYKRSGVHDRKNALREVIRALLVQDGLRVAALEALEHLEELREAWRRGVIDERDGQGGTRSNRNVEISVKLRDALLF
jgi:hypothetical protein